MTILLTVYKRRVAWEEAILCAMGERGITNTDAQAITEGQPVALELCWREGRKGADAAAFILECATPAEVA